MIDATRDLPAALILNAHAGASDEAPEVFSLTAGERLRRSLIKAGVSRIDRIGPADAPPETTGRCILLRGDYFYDERLIAGLIAARNCILTTPDGEGKDIAVAASTDGPRAAEAIDRLRGAGSGDSPAAADEPLRLVRPLDIAPAYNAALRRYDPPFVHEARREALREIEDRIFAASYKGLTDLVTKWVFPTPARAAVRILARFDVRPNTVTAWSYVLAAVVTWLFAEGWFAAGLALGWVMTFLDTVDGKLARCTITSSRFGNFFDHALDQVHPPIWWGAFAFGLPGGLEENALAFWVVVGGYLVGRALEGVFLAAFGMEFFVWRRFDGVFRTVVARRNPNLILLSLGVAFGSAAAGYAAVAVWTVVCILIAACRNVQAFARRSRGTAIRPWLNEAMRQE